MGWKAVLLAAVKRWKKGEATARPLRKWTRSFLNDRNDLPFNLYGTWNTCMLQDGNLAKEISTHLQSIGKYVAAQDIVDFLQTDDIHARYSLLKTISLRTAQRWMHLMDNRWAKEPGGQYVDGHERKMLSPTGKKNISLAWPNSSGISAIGTMESRRREVAPPPVGP
jgi:hypothetical protein